MSEATQADAGELLFDTSDPLATPATPATPVAEQEKPAEQAPTTETVEETEKPSDEVKADKTFTQAELDEIVQKRIAKFERKAERQRIEAETRQKIEQEYANKPAPLPDEPNVEDFSDYGDYLKAAAKWEVKQELAAERETQAKSQQQATAAQEQQRKQERQSLIFEQGNNKYDDFDEIAISTGEHLKSKGLSFSPQMVDTLIETDNGADIVNYLGTHLDEAERIAKLSPYGQAKEIGKLEDKLASKAPLKTSNAPAPVTPISSGKSSTKSLDDMTTEEYIADARKRGAAWAR